MSKIELLTAKKNYTFRVDGKLINFIKWDQVGIEWTEWLEITVSKKGYDVLKQFKTNFFIDTYEEMGKTEETKETSIETQYKEVFGKKIPKNLIDKWEINETKVKKLIKKELDKKSWE